MTIGNKTFSKVEENPSQIALDNKSFNFWHPQDYFLPLPLLALVISSVICIVIVCSLATARRSEGSWKTIAPC